MSSTKDSFLDLERHRLQLEENVKRLKQSLQHWQTWDAEYESLKEEVDEVPEGDEPELVRIRENFEGELVNRREIDEIFGADSLKPKDQIKNILERRIDYVTKNVENLQKQVEAAENKYAAASVISQPDAMDEEGQPITEIVEELDDDDNVISYRLNKPGDSLPHVREALEKAGVADVSKAVSDAKSAAASSKTPEAIVKRHQGSSASTLDTESRIKEVVPMGPVPASKGVSFAADTKLEDGPQPQVSKAAKRVEQIMKDAKEQESTTKSDPIIPEDEDAEDAELRQEMLKYSMGEVGAVVAELTLDEGSDDEDDYEFDYSDEGFEDGDDDEEDKYGRSTGRIITDDYHQRMLELEQRLGVKSRFTAQMEEKAESAESDNDEGIGRIVVKRDAKASPSTVMPAPAKSIIKEKSSSGKDDKKGVRFALSLDIAPDDEPAATPAAITEVKEKEPVVEPVSEVVIERSTTSKLVEPEAEKKSTRKPSRFKKARDGGAADNNNNNNDNGIPQGPFDVPPSFIDEDRPLAPTGPEGATIANTLVEREVVAAPIPDGEIDDALIHGEVAGEYHRMRKKFIQREGGFLKEDESPIQPLDEADGGRERVSRFKAARLSKQ